jgi:nucleoside-diphosphate-sugar epimerase
MTGMIYIVGGKGFVGSGFVRLFEKLKLEYAVITRDNYRNFADTGCDVLINANGNSGKLLAMREPLADFDANVRVTRALLEDFKCGFYIHLSSCDVYPDCSGPESTREDTPIDLSRQSPYGFHKLLAEQCVRHRHRDWLIIRQGGFVGPGMKKNAVYDILYGDKLWLHPESELQFMHTDDSAELIWNVYRQGVRNEIFNLCGCGLVKLRDVMRWSKRNVVIDASAQLIQYNVSINKLKKYVTVPESEISVYNFVENITRI